MLYADRKVLEFHCKLREHTKRKRTGRNLLKVPHSRGKMTQYFSGYGNTTGVQSNLFSVMLVYKAEYQEAVKATAPRSFTLKRYFDVFACLKLDRPKHLVCLCYGSKEPVHDRLENVECLL